MGGRGGHQKITEDHNYKEGGRGHGKIGQTEGAQKGNNLSQDQLSMGGLRGDTFIDQYCLYQDSSLTPYLTFVRTKY